MAPLKSIIRITEEDGPSEAGAEGGFDLPGQKLALAGCSFSQAVHPKLAQHQGLVIGEHLQARQVAFKSVPLVQINIEAHKVDALWMKKLRRRKRSEGAERIRVEGFGLFHQFVNELADASRAAPADNFGRDFIDHAVRKNGRASFAGGDGLAHNTARLRLGVS